MVTLDITQVLNTWAQYGVFSYVFPFLIIFAVVFAILQKSGLFGVKDKEGKMVENVKGINAIIAVSIALISLLNDYVPTFFAAIFPKFGIILAVGLVLLILIAFTGGDITSKWLGWVLGVVVVIWGWSEWSNLYGTGSWGVTYFLEEYFWGLVLLGAIGGLIYWIVKDK